MGTLVIFYNNETALSLSVTTDNNDVLFQNKQFIYKTEDLPMDSLL